MADAAAIRDWLVEVKRPELHRVQLFVLQPDGRWEPSAEMGDSVPFAARIVPHRHFVFPIRFAQDRVSLMLRVQSDTAGMIAATLWRPSALASDDLVFYCLSGAYFGALGALLLYNLLLYAMVRDRGHLLFVACIVGSMVSYGANSGLATEFLWGENVRWNGHLLGIAWAASSYFRIAQTRHFLSTRERLPWADKLLAIFGWCTVAFCPVSLLVPRSLAGQMLLVILFGGAVLMAAVSIIAVLRRWPGARYYCASWLVLIGTALASGARFLGWMPANLQEFNILPLGAVIGYVLLSIALAHQINEGKRQKEEAQALALAMSQASQALASETRLDGLHARTQQVVASLTGATAVRLVLWDEDSKEWFLHEPGSDSGRVSLVEASQRGLLALSALRHVESTRAPLMITDVHKDGRFSSDPIFAGKPRCSMMVLPILRLGALHAVLILENTETRDGFSAAAIDALLSIAGTLATSLENVLLYERLEQRVADKTRELREAQDELLVTARRAGMAEIATNVLHNVGNILNSVNVSVDLMRRHIQESHSVGLARAVDLMDAHAGDLGNYLQHDPRGRLLPHYLRQLSAEMTREREELLKTADDLTLSVDHLKEVVATQQTYAGPSMLVEMLQPAELLDQALRITRDSLQRHRVEVIKECAPVGAARIDKARTLQILVNLITNATQAMDDVVDRARVLRIELDDAGGMLRFRVQDVGRGIAPEDLSRIFAHGFTTRQGGHGFGLHSCALAASQMDGSLTVHSDGPGQGATFTLQLPLANRPTDQPRSPSHIPGGTKP